MLDLPSSVIEALNNATTLEDLAGIARSFSAAATNPNGVLYSDDVTIGGQTYRAYEVAPSIASSLGYGIIDQTQRGQFLQSAQFNEALDRGGAGRQPCIFRR